ncbi:hypothetical protein [Streptomyces sp. NPDC017086]|uniref:hypothetical protein n=1 Tax=Streptomyces sp. NPDC017086 TaxID=3364976 RepID=UPI0037BD9540
MHRAKAFFVGGLAAVTLVAGTAAAIATTTVEEEPPPDAPPSWVMPDGSVDPSAIPQEAPEILSDGRPNDNQILGPQIPNEPLSTSGTNPPGVISSDPDPADGYEEGTELLESELPEATCGWVTQTPTGGKLVVDVCSLDSQRAANGKLQDTVATDGKCINATISIGTYSRVWKACDGKTVPLDTGYRDGTVVRYTFSVA